MAADVTDKLWSVRDIVALIEADAPKPGPLQDENLKVRHYPSVRLIGIGDLRGSRTSEGGG
jgi:hypothetical protein